MDLILELRWYAAFPSISQHKRVVDARGEININWDSDVYDMLWRFSVGPVYGENPSKYAAQRILKHLGYTGE